MVSLATGSRIWLAGKRLGYVRRAWCQAVLFIQILKGKGRPLQDFRPWMGAKQRFGSYIAAAARRKVVFHNEHVQSVGPVETMSV
jgi:hypothetical protein